LIAGLIGRNLVSCASLAGSVLALLIQEGGKQKQNAVTMQVWMLTVIIHTQYTTKNRATH